MSFESSDSSRIRRKVLEETDVLEEHWLKKRLEELTNMLS